MSNPPPVRRPQRLRVLPAEEGSCLLRSYALQKIREDPKEVVILYYSQEPARGGDGGDRKSDQCGEMVPVDPEVGLYAPGPPITINEQYSHTWQKSGSRIWVMDRVGCKVAEAEKFIKAVVGDTSSSQGVLKAKSLEIFDNFITGISLRADYNPDYFTIFVSLPYLGVGYKASINESRTLRQYRLRESANFQVKSAPIATDGGLAILVHQTWLLSFHDERIGIFRSEDDGYWDRAPLFPYQQRMAASQALVHMISNLLTSSENEALKIFRSKVNQLELLEDGGDNTTEGENNTTPGRRTTKEKDTVKNKNKLFKSYGGYMKDVSTMMEIVRSQISHLDDLRQIFECSYESKRLTGRPMPHRNAYPIPLLKNQPEQLEDVVNSITAIVAERERTYQELLILFKDIEVARTLCLDGNQTGTQNSLLDTVEAHAKSQAVIEETLKAQGQTISVFTLITTVFLPLGFFCSYYAVPGEVKGPGPVFWLIAGPVTAAITAVMGLFLIISDDRIKRALVGWWESPPESPREKANVETDLA